MTSRLLFDAQQKTQKELSALGELHMRSRGATADHILAFCPLYHPPNETLGLAALDDDTVVWLQTTKLCF